MLESNPAAPSIEASLERGAAPPSKAPAGALASGGILAVLASVCCVAPLVLVSLGLGGAWVAGMIDLFTPWRPYLMGATLLVLGFAGWRIYRPAAICGPDGAVCALPRTRTHYKIVFWVVAALSAALLAFPYYGYLFF